MNKLPTVLFEKSGEGKTGYSFRPAEFTDEYIAIDRKEQREPISGFPQLSEVELVRHYTHLAKLNYSVDTGFYPLGSCTMKYNPKINEKISSFESFSSHPYSPNHLVQGNLEIIKTLEKWLIEITGMHAFTMAPSAGAHGELAGIMIIRKCLAGRGDARKTILIPDSAHGTNPASAHFSGYEIKEIPSNSEGVIDIRTVKENLNQDVAALMVTNPNTLGIFEKNIIQIAEILHENGSLLYMDGANMNAFMGIVRPGDLGVDVLHLNLHKTFSTPHGGGGPGSGPIGVAEHLADLLPVPTIHEQNGNYRVEYFNDKGIGRIKNFHGNFLVMVRALAYLMSVGKENLRQVAIDSVLNANYIRKKLETDLDLPYSSKSLHEVIFSDKGLNVKTLDIAKRLLDFGMHPFTVYFPLIIHGAMMIEPTETESLGTLNEFIDTMRTILKEARQNPEILSQAPFTTPVRRLDEVLAARQLVLKWQPMEE